MADYRNYIRTAAGFNGATVDAAVYSGTRFVFTTPTTSAVGRFTPAILGRENVASIARVAMSGVVAPGDYVRVLDASGATRFELEASVAGTPFFFLNPTDVISVSAAGATAANILVNDLSDDQALTWAQVEAEQVAGSSAPQPLISAAVAIAVAGFGSGTYYITGQSAAPATVTLAAVADFGVGARVVLLNDSAVAYTIDPDGAELINGAANLVIAAGDTVSVEAAGTQWIGIPA